MCVVCIVDNTRPTDKMVAQMYQANKFGAGIAWRETRKLKGTKGEEKIVHWRKGLKLEEVQELVRTVPIPFIAHFRIPSCGPDVPELNHPFPISDEVEMFLDGVIPGWVLFHNGTWHHWKDMLFDSCLKAGVKIPKGPWSDTRAMALVVKKLGLNALEFIDEKTVAFGPSQGNCLINGNGWSRVAVDDGEKKHGVLVSNEGWTHVRITDTPADDDNDDLSHYGGYPGIHMRGMVQKCHYHNVHTGNCQNCQLPSNIYCYEHTTLEKRTACDVEAFKEFDKEKKKGTQSPADMFSVVKPGGASSSAERTFPLGSNETPLGPPKQKEVEGGKTGVESSKEQGGGSHEGVGLRAVGPPRLGRRAHSSVIVVDEHGKARREPLIVGDASLEDLPRWASSFNPKRYRGRTAQSLDDVHRDARRRSAELGITVVGSL